MMLRLPAQWEQAIRAEGEKAYPHECCGVLLGVISGSPDDADDRSVEAIVPIDNARETEEQYHRFRIEPEDLMRAEQAARAHKQDVLGFYHSHPDHPARPSEYDRDHALPFYSYVIVSVEQSKAVELTSWRLSANRKKFIEEVILFQK